MKAFKKTLMVYQLLVPVTAILYLCCETIPSGKTLTSVFLFSCIALVATFILMHWFLPHQATSRSVPGSTLATTASIGIGILMTEWLAVPYLRTNRDWWIFTAIFLLVTAALTFFGLTRILRLKASEPS